MKTAPHSLAVAVVAAGLALAPAAQAASAKQGQVLAQRNCAGCHAIGALGASPNPTAPPFRDLHRSIAIDQLTKALKDGLLSAHPAMPEFRFVSRELDDLAAYLRSIQGRDVARAGGVGGKAAL